MPRGVSRDLLYNSRVSRLLDYCSILVILFLCVCEPCRVPSDMAEVEARLQAMTDALAEKEAELVDLTARHNIAIQDTNAQVARLEDDISRMAAELEEAREDKEAALELQRNAVGQVEKLTLELNAARQGKNRAGNERECEYSVECMATFFSAFYMKSCLRDMNGLGV